MIFGQNELENKTLNPALCLDLASRPCLIGREKDGRSKRKWYKDPSSSTADLLRENLE